MAGGLDAVRRIDACLRERRPDLSTAIREARTPLAGYGAIGEELGTSASTERRPYVEIEQDATFTAPRAPPAREMTGPSAAAARR